MPCWKIWIALGLALQLVAAVPVTWNAMKPEPWKSRTNPLDPEHTNPDYGMIVRIDNTPSTRERWVYFSSVILIAIGALSQLIGLLMSP